MIIKDFLKRHLKGDWQIWMIYFLLSMIGTLAVYSSTYSLAYRESGGNTESHLLKHVVSQLLGFFFAWLLHRFNYRVLIQYARPMLYLSLALMLYTLFKGVDIGDARRWVRVFGISFQTSDIVRLVLIVNIALVLAQRQNVAKNEYDFKSISEITIWAGLFCLLLGIPNFSTAVLLGLTCFMIFWVGRVPGHFIMRMGAVIIVTLVIGIAASLFLQKVGINFGRGEVVVNRVEAFIGYDLNGDGSTGGRIGGNNDQRDFSLASVASGGIFGAGPGRSAQRYQLSEAHSDFIFSVIVGEYGLVGGIVVISLYLWLMWNGLKNIQNTYRAFGGILSIALTLSITIQAFMHILINVGLLPITGQTLPLISKGGSSILITSIMFGIVLSVSRGEEDTSAQKRRTKRTNSLSQ
ncbi:MAG: FtsW/RodA/SpoVE family cell cycle protein [Spirosomataceae bacterium]